MVEHYTISHDPVFSCSFFNNHVNFRGTQYINHPHNHIIMLLLRMTTSLSLELMYTPIRFDHKKHALTSQDWGQMITSFPKFEFLRHFPDKTLQLQSAQYIYLHFLYLLPHLNWINNKDNFAAYNHALTVSWFCSITFAAARKVYQCKKTGKCLLYTEDFISTCMSVTASHTHTHYTFILHAL